MILNFFTQLYLSKREEKRISIRLYKQRQANTLEEILEILSDLKIYLHSKLAELGPNEHYMFSLNYLPEEKYHFEYHHMVLEKKRIELEAYIPKEVEYLLSELSNKIALTKNVEIWDISDADKESGYTDTNIAVHKTRDEIRKYMAGGGWLWRTTQRIHATLSGKSYMIGGGWQLAGRGWRMIGGVSLWHKIQLYKAIRKAKS